MPNPEPRSYRQFCGLARALDVVGERWTLLIVRNLLLGPRRYGDLLDELPGMTTNLLAKRLKDLTARRLVRKVMLPPPYSTPAYELTEDGAALEPAIVALGGWGARYLDAPKKGDRVDVAWGLFSLKRRYRGGVRRIVELRVGERAFTLRFEPERLDVKERTAERPDVIVTAPLGVVAEAFFARGGRSLAALRAAGVVAVEGDEEAFDDLVAALAPLPPSRAAGPIAGGAEPR